MNYLRLYIKTNMATSPRIRAQLVAMTHKAELPITPTALGAGRGQQSGDQLGLRMIPISKRDHSFELLAIGPQGAADLRAEAPKIMRALTPENGGVPEFQFKEGAFRVRPASEPYRYAAPNFVISLDAEERRKAQARDFAAITPAVGERIERAINRQVQWISPGAAPVRVCDLTLNRAMGVHVKAGCWRSLIDAHISLDAFLEGPWQAGSLQSRGYGRLYLAA